MSDTIVQDSSLGLYFVLRNGEKADLEVVAEAAINWVAALRAAAKELDPASEIRVEFVDAKESSLRLNTYLEWLDNQAGRIQSGWGKYPRLKKLAIGAIIFGVVTGYPTYDFYFGDDAAPLSDDDRRRMDEIIDLLRDKASIEQPKRDFFRTLERDPSIAGVGLVEAGESKPKNIIPSDQFPERGGLWSAGQSETGGEERTLYPVLPVTLLSAVLEKKKVRWKFQPDGGLPAFTAKMADERFLEALEAHRLHESLRIGIRMTIRLKIVEVNSGGVWIPKKRTVVEVVEPRP